MYYDRCDYCGLENPLVMRGMVQVNVLCTHTEEGNREAERRARENESRPVR